MVPKAFPPSSQTTLAIILGASEWPYSPEFQPSQAFANAANGFKSYLLNPQQFGIPHENLLDLFDSTKNASEIDEDIDQFLEERVATLKTSGIPVRDILVYFVGHGGFAGRDSDFYLTIRRTRTANMRASGIYVAALADTLLNRARHLRRLLIFDCCFAAAAFKAFQTGPAQVAIKQMMDALEVREKGHGFPNKGTALLCSSDHKTASQLLPNERCTMFSQALLDMLSIGDIRLAKRLSLRNLKELTDDWFQNLSMRNAPRPVVHSPDQSEGDVADIPFFPNLASDEQRKDHEVREQQTWAGDFDDWFLVRPKSKIDLVYEAHRAILGEKYQKALILFDRALLLPGGFSIDTDIYMRKGRLLEKLNRLPEALDAYEQAIRLTPDWRNLLEKGSVLVKLQRYKEALSTVEQCKCEHDSVYMLKGEILGHLGRVEESEKAYDHARYIEMCRNMSWW